MWASYKHDDTVDALYYTLKGVEMGCDIHWHSETKRDGKWLCDQAESFKMVEAEDEASYLDMANFPNRNRDYWFFGLIQPGVRTEWDWSFPERLATPDDLSMEVKILRDEWDGDDHSHGYLTREELKAKLEELKLLRTSDLIEASELSNVRTHHFNRLTEVIENLASEVPDTDQRIVFWFDN